MPTRSRTPAALAPHIALRHETITLYRSGQFDAAVQCQLRLINEFTRPNVERSGDFSLLGALFMALGDPAAAVQAMREAMKLAPHDLTVQENLGVALSYTNRLDEAIAQFEQLLALGHSTVNVLDAMANLCGKMKRWEDAKRYGGQSLLLKDREACAAYTGAPLQLTAKPVFQWDAPERNIIAFSLWGDKPRYLLSAVENVRAARYVYPSWRCRFYCDTSVPSATLTALKAEGGEVVMMPANKLYEGLHWRFFVANDRNIDYFLVRDADAVVNVKERAAVDEWLASDRHFHTMHDFYTHSELILAGMWGGVAQVLPDIAHLLKNFKPQTLTTRSIDQHFLRFCVWPLIRGHVLTHDSQFGVLAARPFPPCGRLPAQCHIGQSVIH